MPKKQEGAQRRLSRGWTSPAAALGALLCRGPAVAHGDDELCEGQRVPPQQAGDDRGERSCEAVMQRARKGGGGGGGDVAHVQ